jgi:hypothetical protein
MLHAHLCVDADAFKRAVHQLTRPLDKPYKQLLVVHASRAHAGFNAREQESAQHAGRVLKATLRALGILLVVLFQ